MNFEFNDKGTSFRGVMTYLLHDKRQPGEADPGFQTSERVAWSEILNMDAAPNIHAATRIMIDTARQAERIKAENGSGGAGRKGELPVFHMSLQWRGDELGHDDRDKMEAAARDVLRLMKLDHLQAVMVAHKDTANPHVHIVVNRRDPETGLMANLDYRTLAGKLDRLCYDWERGNGKIVSPDRAAKYEAQEQKRRSRPTDPDELKKHKEDRKAARKSRKAEAAKTEAATASDLQKVADTKPTAGDRQDQDAKKPRQESDQAKPKPLSPGQILKDLSDAQKARHAAEWTAWKVQAARDRAAIYRWADAQKKAADAAAKEACRPHWGAHFRDDRDRRRAFEQRERAGFFGVVRNAIDAARVQLRKGMVDQSRGLFGQTVRNVLSAKARREGMEVYLSGRADSFRGWVNGCRDIEREKVEALKRDALAQMTTRLDREKSAIKAQHDLERGKMREAWQQHYARKAEQAPGSVYRRAGARPTPVAEQVATAKHYFRAAAAPADDPDPRPPLPTAEPRASRSWADLKEDRAIMSGAEETHPDNMRRREEDAAAQMTDLQRFWKRVAEDEPPEPRKDRPGRKQSRDYGPERD